MSMGTMEQRTEGMKRQAQELIEQAYQRGFKAGQEKAFVVDSDKYREQGRNEAWEAVKKIYLPVDEGGLPGDEIKKLFGTHLCIDVVKNFSASEVVEKLHAYEKQKKQEDSEIRVGDVIRNDDVEAVVTWCNGKDWNGFLLKGEGVGEVGQVYSCMSCNYWKKTGRTFPEIAEVLKKLQEGE